MYLVYQDFEVYAVETELWENLENVHALHCTRRALLSPKYIKTHIDSVQIGSTIRGKAQKNHFQAIFWAVLTFPGVLVRTTLL